MDVSLEIIYEIGLVFAICVKAFQGGQIVAVVVAHDLFVMTVLVSEHAAAAIHAMLLLVEDSAVFSSSFVRGLGCNGCAEDTKFFFPVCKLTLVSISAFVVFDPIFAHFCLVLVFRYVLFLLSALRDLLRVLRGVA